MPERKLIDKDEALQFRADNGSLHTLRVTNDGQLYFEGAEDAPSTDAIAMWKASSYDGSSQLLKDLSGNGHHLKFGSSHPAYVTNGYLVLPGQTGNYASTPDSAAVSITGDIDIRVKVAATDWTPSPAQVLIGVNNGHGTAGAYALDLRSTGKLRGSFFLASSPSTAIVYESTQVVPAQDGEEMWLRITRSSTSGNVTFYTSSDGSSWNQLGTTVSGTSGALADSAVPLYVGHAGDVGAGFSGRIYWAEIRNGIDGPVVAKFDPSSQVDLTTSWTASTGEVWTINSAASTDGSDPLFLPYEGEKYVNFPGTPSNNVRIPDAANLRLAATDTFTVTAAITLRAEIGTENSIISKRATGSSDGWALYYIPATGNPRLRFYLGTESGTWNNVTSSALPSTYLGQKLWVRASGNGSSTPTITFSYSTNGNSWTVLNSVAMSGTGVYAGSSTDAVRIGTRSDGVSEPFNGAVHTVRLDKNASTVLNVDLSVAELDTDTFLALTGQTVTINRATSGRKTVVVDRDLFLFGTDDYMEAVDNSQLDFDSGESFTVAAVYRHYGAMNGGIVVKESNAGARGWLLSHQESSFGGNRFQVHDGTVESNIIVTGAGMIQDGAIEVVTGVRDNLASIGQLYIGGVNASEDSATTGDLRNSQPLRVGAFSNGAPFADMEFLGAAIWRRALTDEEISYLAGEFNV